MPLFSTTALLAQSWQSRPSLGCLFVIKNDMETAGIKMFWQRWLYLQMKFCKQNACNVCNVVDMKASSEQDV